MRNVKSNSRNSVESAGEKCWNISPTLGDTGLVRFWINSEKPSKMFEKRKYAFKE